MDRRYEDDRQRRLNRTGMAAGATGGAIFGLVAGAILPGIGSAAAALFGGLVGLAVGGLLGRGVVTRVDAEEMDPTNQTRPFVGLHAPDEDEVKT
jgi:hypothetical protein